LPTRTNDLWPLRRSVNLLLSIGALALFLSLVRASGGAASSSRPVVPCATASSAALLRFTTAFNAGSVNALDKLPRGQDTGSDRSTLSAYFADRHVQHDELALVSAQMKVTRTAPMVANFTAVFERTASDLPDGPKPFLAKGAFTCVASSASLSVWAMGEKPATG
jgi:hypothetical protein